MERETGFEPATSTLARSHSTAELLPLGTFSLYRRPNRGFKLQPGLMSSPSLRLAIAGSGGKLCAVLSALLDPIHELVGAFDHVVG